MAEGDKPDQKPQRFFVGDSLNFPLFKVGSPVPSGTAAPKPETTASNTGTVPAGKKPETGSKNK